MSKQDNFDFEDSKDYEELADISTFKYSEDESENSDGEFDCDAEERDFRSTVFRLKVRAEDKLTLRYCLLYLCTFIFFISIFVFWNTHIEIKEKFENILSTASLGVIFLHLFFSSIVFLFLSFCLYNMPCFYISELSEHISLILICIFYISFIFYHKSNCCIQHIQGVEIYIEDLLNIILISIFLFAGLKLWSQNIGINFNYSIYIERIRKCLVEDLFLNMFKRKNNPKRIEYLIKTFVTGWEMDLARRRILFKEFQKNYKSSARMREKYLANALKRSNNLHFRALINYKITFISDISNLFINEDYNCNGFDNNLVTQYNELGNYSEKKSNENSKKEISFLARSFIKIIDLPLKYRLDGKGFFRIIKRVDREKYILIKNLEQMNAALDRVCIFIKYLIVIMAGLMLYIKVSNELASTTGVISAIFGTQILSNSFSANAINSLIFLFIIHPYDIGDRIFVSLDNNLENLVVQELNVFSTVFHRWNGTCVYVPNSVLCTKLITNIRRSGIIADSHKIQINARTDQSKLLNLKSTIEAFLRKHNEDFTEYYMVNYEYIENSNKLHMRIYMQYKTNSQNYELYLRRKTNFLSFLNRSLQSLDIEYCLPPQRIVMKK